MPTRPLQKLQICELLAMEDDGGVEDMLDGDIVSSFTCGMIRGYGARLPRSSKPTGIATASEGMGKSIRLVTCGQDVPLLEGIAMNRCRSAQPEHPGVRSRITAEAHVRTIHFTKEAGEWVIDEAMRTVRKQSAVGDPCRQIGRE